MQDRKRDGSNDGGELEDQTAKLLRLYAGSVVQRDVLIVGKKVDILLITSGPLLPAFRVAVECKDWARPLTREQCSSVLADYLPLLDQRAVDQFLLISRNGIVATAKRIFDGRRLQHLTFSELADQLFNPRPLIDNIQRQYRESSLSQVYIEQYAAAPDVRVASAKYDVLYNDFIDFALDTSMSDLDEALDAWVQSGGTNTDQYKSLYETDGLASFLHDRRPVKVHLLQYVLDWVSATEPVESLAILGSYGTGKSSFARRLAFLLAQRYLEDPVHRIPFIIELKEFGSHQDIRGLITHELVNRHGVTNGSFELFQSLNQAGRFVVILDGFDEMKQGLTADTLLFNFNQLAQLSGGKSRVVLCGRPTLFESNAEQNRILTGNFGVGMGARARYVQVEVAPFSIEQSCSFLELTAKASPAAVKRSISAFVAEVRRLEAERLKQQPWTTDLSGFAETRSILARPVHLPMLVSVLPRRELDPMALRRSVLYSEFVDAIIEREMLKRRAEFISAYSAKARRLFARSVSIEMARRGESRSIRTSELPAVLLEGFVGPGRPIEAVRRDLISACFLERKGIDILYFPHKSFWEFLVAEEIAEMIANAERPDTDAIGFKITDEMVEFLNDLLSEDAWERLAAHSERNMKLLAHWVRKKTSEKAIIPETLIGRWVDTIAALDERFQRAVSGYLTSRAAAKTMSGECMRLARQLVGSTDDVAGVNAYRALSYSSEALEADAVIEIIGHARAFDWYMHKWVEFSAKTEDEFRRYMVCRLATTMSAILTSRSNN